MGNGNRPTPEFLREAVRLALTSGRTRPESAEDGHLPVDADAVARAGTRCQ